MKPMALNLSKMKKVEGDDKSSTFLHPNGHKMVIAHSGVSALQKKQLEKIPVQNYADGDVVIPMGQQSSSDDQTPPWLQNTSSVSQGYPVVAQEQVSSAPSVSTESKPVQTAQRSSIKSSGGLQIPVKGTDATSGYNQYLESINEEKGIQTQEAAAKVPELRDQVADRKALYDDFQNRFKNLLQAQQDFIDDYKDGKINPNAYWDNMTPGQDLASSIGLFLGGFSTPFTHQGNPALDYINKQIDRNIAAQQSNINNRKTILEANRQMLDDDVAGLNQTRVNMNDILALEMQKKAAELGTPQAQQAADAAAGKFKLDNLQTMQQSAARTAVINHMKQGGGGLTAMDLSTAGLVPSEQAAKEQTSIDAQNKAIAVGNEIYQKLKEEQTLGNLLNPQSYARRDALNAQLVNGLMEADVVHRLTPETAALEIKPFFPGTFNTNKSVEDFHEGYNRLIRQHATPTPYMSEMSPNSLPQYPKAKPEPVVRVTSDGRQALFDPTTKKFLGYKQ